MMLKTNETLRELRKQKGISNVSANQCVECGDVTCQGDICYET